MKFMMSLHGIKYHWEAPFFVRVLEKIDPFRIIDGFEINADPTDSYERNYLLTLATLMASSTRKLQFHCHPELQLHYNDLNYLTTILSFYHDLSKILCYEVQLVIHPVDSYDIEVSISRTYKFLENLNMITQKHHYNIAFTLENLNNTSKHNRLNTPEIQSLVVNNSSIGICWDIGHEVSEGICCYQLNATLLSALKNVHIHDVFDKDHYPFDYGNTDYRRAIHYLEGVNYVGSVIIEINIALLKGNSLLEKFRGYIDNIRKLKNYYYSISHYEMEKDTVI